MEQEVGDDKVVEYLAMQCEDGYQGPLCGVCSPFVTTGKQKAIKYGLHRAFTCNPCG